MKKRKLHLYLQQQRQQKYPLGIEKLDFNFEMYRMRYKYERRKNQLNDQTVVRLNIFAGINVIETQDNFIFAKYKKLSTNC